MSGNAFLPDRIDAAALQHVSIDVPLATIKAKTSGTPFNVGSALPSNARLVAAEVNVLQVVGGGAISACTSTLQATSETAGAVLASADVHGGTGVKGALGSNPYPSRGGQQMQLTLTATGDTLANATTGHLTVDLYYAVLG